MDKQQKIMFVIIISLSILFLLSIYFLVIISEISTTPCWMINSFGLKSNSTEVWNRLNECGLATP